VRLLAQIALLALAACATDPVPATVELDRSEYDRAFDAALEVARRAGLHPVVADRSLGVIETDARAAGSLLEPWRTDNASMQESVAHTVNFERRRARFEFVPEPFELPVPQPSAPSAGAALPGSERAEGRVDLVAWKGPIQMRTWVMLDREFIPNQQIGRWTLGESRTSQDPTQARDPKDTSTRTPGQWTPIGRDVQYERRLTEGVLRIVRPPAG
jgi:hypothetical protein